MIGGQDEGTGPGACGAEPGQRPRAERKDGEEKVTLGVPVPFYYDIAGKIEDLAPRNIPAGTAENTEIERED